MLGVRSGITVEVEEEIFGVSDESYRLEGKVGNNTFFRFWLLVGFVSFEMVSTDLHANIIS